MEYVPSFERIALKKGFKQGIKQGIEQGIRREKEHTKQALLALAENLKLTLEIKFGKKASVLLPIISKLKSPEDMIAFQNKIKKARSIEELMSMRGV